MNDTISEDERVKFSGRSHVLELRTRIDKMSEDMDIWLYRCWFEGFYGFGQGLVFSEECEFSMAPLHDYRSTVFCQDGRRRRWRRRGMDILTCISNYKDSSTGRLNFMMPYIHIWSLFQWGLSIGKKWIISKDYKSGKLSVVRVYSSRAFQWHMTWGVLRIET